MLACAASSAARRSGGDGVERGRDLGGGTRSSSTAHAVEALGERPAGRRRPGRGRRRAPPAPRRRAARPGPRAAAAGRAGRGPGSPQVESAEHDRQRYRRAPAATPSARVTAPRARETPWTATAPSCRPWPPRLEDLPPASPPSADRYRGRPGPTSPTACTRSSARCAPPAASSSACCVDAMRRRRALAAEPVGPGHGTPETTTAPRRAPSRRRQAADPGVAGTRWREPGLTTLRSRTA